MCLSSTFALVGHKYSSPELKSYHTAYTRTFLNQMAIIIVRMPMLAFPSLVYAVLTLLIEIDEDKSGLQLDLVFIVMFSIQGISL